MAEQYYQPIYKQYKSLTVNGDGPQIDLNNPFAVRVSEVDTVTHKVTVKISPYSAVFQTTSILDRLFILGLDCPLEIEYGDKIWLEIFFDTSRTPIMGILRKGKKWEAESFSNSTTENKQKTYPDIIDLITKRDIENRTKVLQDIAQELVVLKDSFEDEIDLLVSSGYYTAPEGSEMKAQFQDNYTSFKTIFDEYVGQTNNFFVENTTDLFKKQFRLFIPIVYTTKNLSSLIKGEIVDAGSIDKSQGGAKVAANVLRFKIVPAQDTNLLLVDSAYQNLYPAKIAIPYQKPVYNYLISNEEEEEIINPST